MTTEIIKNNYTIDFSGVGFKKFDFTPAELKQCIEQDILNSYDCVSHLSTLVKLEESLNTDEKVQLSIHLYMKVLDCEERDSMLGVISSYLNNTFINKES